MCDNRGMIVPKKLPKDPNQRVHEIARMLTEGPQPGEIVTEHSEALSQAGSRGGRNGGKARAKNLSAVRRKAIARKAAKARWQKNGI